MASIRKTYLSPRIISGIIITTAGLAVLAGCLMLKRRIVVPLPEPPARLANALKLSKDCMECHEETAELFENDRHASVGFSCVVCHGESKAHLEMETEGAKPDRTWRVWMEDEGRFEWRMDLATLQIARFCASCHGQAQPGGKSPKQIDWNAYINGPHGRAVVRGNEDAPTCSDCHWAHGTTGAESWTDEAVTKRCGGCHASESMMGRADLDPGVVEDFKAGKHATMRWVRAAKKSSCVKCHHPHG